MKTFKMTNGTISATFPAKDMQDARNEVLKFADCSKEIKIEEVPEKITWTRIKNDTNGNPRYVCHFLELLKPFEGQFHTLVNKDGSKMTPNEVCNYLYGKDIFEHRYELALKRARKIGGRKFHNKQYGGGIVFQSYNIAETERQIKELLNEKP